MIDYSLTKSPDKDKEVDFKRIHQSKFIKSNYWLCRTKFGNIKRIRSFPIPTFRIFCVDRDSNPEASGGKLVFNKTVGLRDTWAKISEQ